MNWQCSFLRRRFVPYLEGRIPLRQAARLEKHLAVCPECSNLFQKIRAGHQAGQQFGRLGLETDRRPPEFPELRAGISTALERRGGRVWNVGNMLDALATPLAVRILIILVLAQAVLIVMSNRTKLLKDGARSISSSNALEFHDFTPLRITDFPANTKSRVVTEGYVHDVYFDEEEKTLHIKLVEIQQKSVPFVICEIRSPGGVPIPREGSRVRVYGTARYDSQPGRGWNEVNPVINIDVLKH